MWRRVRWLSIAAVLLPILGFALSVADVIDPVEGMTAALTGLVMAVLARDSE